MQPAFTPRAGRHDEDAERGALHPLSRWVAVAALALVAVLFLLIVLQ